MRVQQGLMILNSLHNSPMSVTALARESSTAPNKAAFTPLLAPAEYRQRCFTRLEWTADVTCMLALGKRETNPLSSEIQCW